MAIPIQLQYQKEISSRKSSEETASFLSNWEKAIPPYFPGISRFKPESAHRYHWEFEKLAHSGKEIQINFSTDFNRQGLTLTMTPVPDSGSAELSGEWKVEPAGEGSKIRFQAELQLELPLPGFLKAMVTPVATKELQKLFDQYAQRLEKALV